MPPFGHADSQNKGTIFDEATFIPLIRFYFKEKINCRPGWRSHCRPTLIGERRALGERDGEPGAGGSEQQTCNNNVVEFGFHKVPGFGLSRMDGV